MHFLLFFVEEDKIVDVAIVDHIACAEFLDLEKEPVLFDTILRTMVHGPCGAHNLLSICMKDGNCSKCYPKTFQESTFIDVDDLLYCRRNNISCGYEVCGILVDNCDVVPYDPYVS